MYSRNYGFSNDTPAKINPPPSYGGSVININAGIEREEERQREAREREKAFQQNETVRRSTEESRVEETPPPREEKEEAHCCAPCERDYPSPPKKDKGLLSGIFSGMSTEDIILLGIIIALVLGLWESDILLVALVVAVVLM